MDATNLVFMSVMAEACNEQPWNTLKYWERIFREAGSGSFHLLGSMQIEGMGMAKPIAELPRLTQKAAANE
jgi:hypothetical protein